MKNLYDKVIVVDLEATCEKYQSKEFISDTLEVGVAVLDMTTLKVIANETTLVIPTQSKVSTFCTELTTITPDMVTPENGAISFTNAMEWVKQFFGKNRVWASWGDYDRLQLLRQCQRENVAYPFRDSHLNIKTLFALCTGMQQGLGTKEATEYLGLPWHGTHHRGKDDAFNIASILAELLLGSRQHNKR